MEIRKLTIGREQAPLLVIDEFAESPETLIRQAVPKHFAAGGQFFPGIRARAPLTYQRFLTRALQDLVLDFFELEGGVLRLSMCHYSLVTTSPGQLIMEQRIPHTDAAGREGLASIHYLFRARLGGTAFYRHRKTGFEFIDESRLGVTTEGATAAAAMAENARRMTALTRSLRNAGVAERDIQTSNL
jgi:hypothetical protein